MKEYITLNQFKETIKNYIDDQNASLVSYGIKINRKYKQVTVLTEDDVPKLFYQRVLGYILHFFSSSQKNDKQSVLIIQFKPINLLHRIECKEYAFALPIKNEKISSKTVLAFTKRMNKLIHRLKVKAGKNTPEIACKANFTDTLRYILFETYGYKHKSNGVNLKTTSFFLLVLSSIVCIVLSVLFCR
jgi:hypothetical protein